MNYSKLMELGAEEIVPLTWHESKTETGYYVTGKGLLRLNNVKLHLLIRHRSPDPITLTEKLAVASLVNVEINEKVYSVPFHTVEVGNEIWLHEEGWMRNKHRNLAKIVNPGFYDRTEENPGLGKPGDRIKLKELGFKRII